MTIEFEDSAHLPVAPEPDLSSPLGYIDVAPSSEWIGSVQGREEEITGASLGDLGNSLDSQVFWMTNMDYKDVRVVQQAAPRIRLHSDNWFRLPVRDYIAELGLDGRVAPAVRSRYMAASFERALRLVTEAAHDLSDLQGASKRLPKLNRSSSLASGLRLLLSDEMPETSLEGSQVGSRLTGLCLSNTSLPPVSGGGIEVAFRMPRMSFAAKVLSGPVPENGEWKRVKIPEDRDLDKSFASELAELNKPVIVYARPDARGSGIPPYLASWTSPPGFSSDIRREYILDEVRELLPYYRFRDPVILVGSGWRSSITARLLSALEKRCGSPRLARLSVSAGLAAENVLCAGMRTLTQKHVKDRSPATLENAWVAMRARMALSRAVNDLASAGAQIKMAYAGRIVCTIPEDPELLLMGLDAAWRHGMVISSAAIRALGPTGVTPPAEAASFGGDRDDYLLSRFFQRNALQGVWACDKIMDTPREKREARLREMMES